MFSKIFEKIIKKRVTSFLDKNNFFSENQYGFRKSLNTEHALLNFTQNVYSSVDANKHTVAIFLDLEKAFSIVYHIIS